MGDFLVSFASFSDTGLVPRAFGFIDPFVKFAKGLASFLDFVK